MSFLHLGWSSNPRLGWSSNPFLKRTAKLHGLLQRPCRSQIFRIQTYVCRRPSCRGHAIVHNRAQEPSNLLHICSILVCHNLSCAAMPDECLAEAATCNLTASDIATFRMVCMVGTYSARVQSICLAQAASALTQTQQWLA